jgi:NADPH2:quinone reductase
LFFRRIRIGGVFVGAMNDAEAHEAWIRVTTLLKAAFKAPVVDRIVDFAQVPKAFDRLEEGPIGKVVIRVSPETS